MLCSFVGAFTDDYTKKADGSNAANFVCWIAIFSPTVQLLFGILFIQYRNIVYVL